MTRPTAPIRYEKRGNVGLILVDRPPVNAIDVTVRTGLAACIEEAAGDAQTAIVLLACAGRTFMAGADIAEFESEPSGPPLGDLLSKLERLDKPVAAVIHGTALGGGLEAAMACHYRAAMRNAHVGLPELGLGLIPGAGGTQRLPRLTGARIALEILLEARPIDAHRALALGILDELLDGDDPVQAGLAYAERLAAEGVGPRRTSDLPVRLEGFDEAGIEDALRANAKALRGRSTHKLLLQALKAAIALPFEVGMKQEQRLAEQSEVSTESRALRHLFFAERGASKLPATSGPADPLPIARVAVVGAGTMGSGIATACSLSGLDVVLLDVDPAGLERGLGAVRSNLDAGVARGRLDEQRAGEALARIEGATDSGAAAGADLVVEAVFEDLELKKRVLAELDAIVPGHAILASNTSTLSVSELAAATSRPDQVVGLHFFTPAHVMRLLEIVRGKSTSAATLATALAVAKRLRKIGVIAGDAFGFIGNRMMLDGYWRENEQLLLEGATPEQVDRVMESFGFAMGPNKVNDMGGVDVGTRARRQLLTRETRPEPYFAVSDALTPMGRLGQKSGKGVYRYEPGDRTAHPDPEVTALIERLAREHGIERREVSDAEIEERCLLSLINVGARVLEEGVAYRAADIDVVWTSGYGFPRYRGGPMFHADVLGVKQVVERVRHYHQALGHYWKPAGLLEQLAARGESFSSWDQGIANESEGKSIRRRSL